MQEIKTDELFAYEGEPCVINIIEHYNFSTNEKTYTPKFRMIGRERQFTEEEWNEIGVKK